MQATWAAADSATGYTIQLYRVAAGQDEAVGAPHTVDATAKPEFTWVGVNPRAAATYYALVTPLHGAVSGATARSARATATG